MDFSLRYIENKARRRANSLFEIKKGATKDDVLRSGIEPEYGYKSGRREELVFVTIVGVITFTLINGYVSKVKTGTFRFSNYDLVGTSFTFLYFLTLIFISLYILYTFVPISI